MNQISSPVKSEKFTACILIDKTNEIAWCVYHPDDDSQQLVFTKNLTDIEDIEIFNSYTVEQVKTHLNTHGFELEPQDYFGDVLRFNNLTNDYEVKLIDIELNRHISINFKL